MTIGNAADARVALRRYNEEESQVRNNPRYTPYPEKGWRRIGSGVSRTAYLSPARVVYKVGDDYVNRDEAHNARRFRRSAKLAQLGVKVPRTRLWHVEGRDVMAMEYVPSHKPAACAVLSPFNNGVCDCRPGKGLCIADLYDSLHRVGIHDMWEGNVRITKDRQIYLIDLGE